MDFRTYLKRLIDQYSEDGLNRYYVPPKAQDDNDLETVVNSWLAEHTSQPIAILGSYGLGKTTFARHIAFKCAQLALTDPTARIPVLVRLGDIANEQSLEGLLGKLFTATNYVKSYNFSTFLELNKLGRFLVIFDGFDEMKQMLSWNDFRYNLHELNRLVCPNSKVIILGRPAAFLTDAEHNYALHGIKTTAAYEVRDPDWPDYREINIVAFEKYQMAIFLPKYILYLIDSVEAESQKARLRAFVNFDVDALLNGTIGDIARRPVQLKMITEILPDFHGKLGDLTVHTLYDYFIDYVIERESFKLARVRFKTKQRRSFARDIAFWLWATRESSVLEEEIPEALIAAYRIVGEDSEAVKRDLVSASLLDRRVGRRLYFPHRSFQEFLVAEAINEKVIQKEILIADLSSALTPQVTDFLRGFIGKKFLAALSTQLDSYRGSLPLSLIKLLCHQPSYREFFSGESPWAHLVTAVAVSIGAEQDSHFRERTDEVLKTTRDTKTAMTIMFATLVASCKWRNPLLKEPSYMIGRSLEALCRIVEAQRPVSKKKTKVKTDFLGNVLVDVIRSLNFSGKGESVVSIMGVYKYVRQELYGYCYISDWDSGTTLLFSDAELPERIVDKNDALRARVHRFLAMIEDEKAAAKSRRAR